MKALRDFSDHIQTLAELDSLTETDADSARKVLTQMPMPTEGSRQWAYYQLVRVKAEDKAKVKHTSDSLISLATEYFERDNRYGHLAVQTDQKIQ